MFRSILQTSSRQCMGSCLSRQGLRSAYVNAGRSLASASRSSGEAAPNAISKASASPVTDLSALKLDSNGSKDLYAIFRLHNMPYLVTKGDSVILPFKLKNVEIGDKLVLNDVTALGSPEYTYTEKKGVSPDLYELSASVTEITREPYYEVQKKKRRCRRIKTFPVYNYQTHLTINELKLK